MARIPPAAAVAALLASLLLSTGCAKDRNNAVNSSALLAEVCVVSGEAIEADPPTADYMGGKVPFCCKKCRSKFLAMSAEEKKAAVDRHRK